MKTPAISVLLPVYNGAVYLAESIQSVLNQTFDDFELIIINDGSTDNSESIVQSFANPRIRYTKQLNHGLAASLNTAIKQARGTYLARQDQDDISDRHRFAQQKAYLDNHPATAVLGTAAKIIVESKLTRRILNHPTSNAALHFVAMFDTPFVHSSVMMRREVIVSAGFYSTDRNRQPPEDYELWSRLPDVGFANLSDLLLTYRETHGSMSRDKNNPLLDKVIKISAENIARVGNKRPDDSVVRCMAELAHRPISDRDRALTLHELYTFFVSLRDCFRSNDKTSKKELDQICNNIWAIISHNYNQNAISHLALRINRLGNKLRGQS